MVTIQLEKINLDTIDSVSEISNFTSIELYQTSSQSEDIMSYIDNSQISEDDVKIKGNNGQKIEKGKVVGAPCCFIPELTVICGGLCTILSPIFAALAGILAPIFTALVAILAPLCAILTPIIGTLGTCIAGLLGSTCAVITPFIAALGTCIVGIMGI
jgi:hypothetical protein